MACLIAIYGLLECFISISFILPYFCFLYEADLSQLVRNKNKLNYTFT